MKKSLEYPFDALVTLDADEQHLPSEIPLFTQSIFEGNQMAIGVRNSDRMPFRSKFSNRFIAKILSLLYKQAPTDNQSGFRAFSFEFTKKIVQLISGGRYEMEFKCILFALKNNIKIDSIPITTIYLKQPTSYFNIFLDSFLILKVFFNHWRTGEI
jgi:hypothetical protein